MVASHHEGSRSPVRVFAASLATETNTFGPIPTGLSSFKDRGYFPAGTHPDFFTFFAGPLWVARQVAPSKGWTLIEGLVAAAQPGGLTTRDAYETLRDELLADLRRALPVDLVLLGLHGAMVAEGYDDCEGDLLAHMRRIAGPHTVIAAELDPHNHLTAAMTDNSDLLVAFKEYPHTDILDRAKELVSLADAAVRGTIRPVHAVVDCHMVVPFHTTRDPARALVDRIKAMEGKDGVLSISITHGFALGDVKDMGTKVLVYCDGDSEKAETLARQLADDIIAMRDDLAVDYLGIDEAIDRALAWAEGPVVLADRADNPGSGAAGDSTFILRRLVKRDIGNAAIGPIWDPTAVRIASEAGVGASLPLRIGGKVGPLSGQPLDLTCQIRALIPNLSVTGLSNMPTPVGDAAFVTANGIDIILTSTRSQAFNVDIFTSLGCDVGSKHIVVVKSAQHFRASFESIARHILYVGAPGAASPDLARLPYRNIARPKWPLD